MNSDIVYSSSLKRMIGFKIFPVINPESIETSIKNNNHNERASRIGPGLQSEKKIESLKKQIKQIRLKQSTIDKQIDNIMNKIVDQGLVSVNNQKIRKNGRKHIRIVTQMNDNEYEKQKFRTLTTEERKVKLPIIKSVSANKLRSFRIKTQAKINEQNETYQPVEAQKFIKHYRAGMSSLKKLKIHHIF